MKTDIPLDTADDDAVPSSTAQDVTVDRSIGG